MARFSVRLRQDAQPFTARLGTGSDSLAVTFQSRIEGAANPVYEGDYTVIPTPASQVLKTKNRIMEDDLVGLQEGTICHDAVKTAFLIFSYLMGK